MEKGEVIIIIFKKVRWKNFFSTGNVFTEIELNKSKTTLIIGKNGSGKSTLLDALTFVLFGKPFRNINKPLMVNSINGKDCVVEIEFTTNNTDYKIIRGIKPNIFEIWANGNLIDQQTNMGDYQDYLEQFILKINYKTFTQIVLLGNASFKPFMQLPPAVRREIIEDLLDIQIFSTMNVIAKQKLQTCRESIEKNRIAFEYTENNIKLLKQTLTQLEEANQDILADNTKKIADNERRITELEKEMEEIPLLKIEYDRITAAILAEAKSKNSYRDMHLKISMNYDMHKKNYDFFHDNETCPTCSQVLEETLRNNMQKSSSDKVESHQIALAKLAEKLSDFNKKINSLEEERNDVEAKMREYDHHKTELYRLRDYNKRLENVKVPDKMAGVVEKTTAGLKEANEEYIRIKFEKDELLVERQYLELIISLLKDGGIKTKIIKQYLPLINKYINHYLQEMDFYINFNIDENFQETIKSRFRDDFQYDSFSEGEKMRINLAILFSWRIIAKLKNSISTNLLIMDEIFESSLDGEGTDEFLKIINNLTGEYNTFIISHKRDQLLEKFDQVVKFEKVKDFSVNV